jgi:cytochrome c biogenesis factor
MKISKVNKEAIKQAIYIMLTISATIILLDLYVPIKMWISGDRLSIGEIFYYVKYIRYFPFILAIGVVYSFTSGHNKKEDLNKKA